MTRASGPILRLLPSTSGWVGLTCVVVVCISGPMPRPVLAQTRSDTATSRPVASLDGWADGVWFALTDRDGSYFGRLAEEGTFQRFNPLMDTEYELDLLTGLFPASHDARWASTTRGFRAAGASINHPFIMHLVDWKDEIRVGGRVSLRVQYHRNRSLSAQRDYTRLALRWQEFMGSPWNLETGFGLHFFKPSSDFDLILGRRWITSGGSHWHLRVRLAALDAFSNTIFNGLGVRPEEAEAHFDYLIVPLAARLSLEGHAGPARFELRGGLTNRSEVDVTFPASERPSYALQEQVEFAGILAELGLGPSWAFAVFATWARAETRRRFDSAGESDFLLEEETRTVGFQQRVDAGPSLSLEVEVGAFWRPEDRNGSLGTHVRHRDRSVAGMLTLASPPSPGFAWRMVFAGMDRDAGVLVPQLTAGNLRNVMEWGYSFASGFRVMAGVRWDLDQLSHHPFDGGHLRISSRW